MKNISIALLFLILISGMGMFVDIPVITPDNARAATVYYVDKNGNDAWPGTTTGSPFATIDHAASTATTAGDYVWIMGGTYNERVTVDGNGTSGNPITFRNYDGQKVVISGTGLTTGWNNGGFVLDNKDYITIDGLEFFWWGKAYLDAGSAMSIKNGSDNVIVQNTYSGSIGGSAIWCYNISDVTIYNNEADRVNTQADQEAITLQTVTNFNVTYNYIHDQPGAFTDAWCIECPKEGIDAKVNCSSGTIAYNVIDGARHGIYIDGRPDASNIVIHDNWISNSTEYGIHLNSEAGTGKNISNIRIFNNISYNSGYSEFRISSTADTYDNIYLANNTFYNSTSYVMWIREPGGNITDLWVENNIFSASSGVEFDSGYDSNEHHFENNLYAVTPYYGINYQTGADGMTNPPDDFSLLVSSSAIDNGKTPSIAVGNDIAGTVRPQNGSYDIGAYEYSTVPTGDQITNLSDTSDTTYVYHPGGSTLIHIGKYSIDTSGLGSGNVGTVTFNTRAAVGSPVGTAYLTPSVYLSGFSENGTQRTLGTSVTAYSDVLARPNSGTWTVSDLGLAEFWLTLQHSVTNWPNGARVTQAYVTVDFTVSSGSLSEVTRTVVAGIEIPVVCSYDGVNQSISTGGTTSQALSGAIYTNNNQVHVAEFDGLIDDTIIKSAGTEVLHLDYEPEDCTDTTISDKSASSNDATYLLAANESCVDISYSSINFTGETQQLSSSSYPQDGMGVIEPIGEMPPALPEENPDNVLWVIADALSDVTGVMQDDKQALIPIQLIATCIYLFCMIWVWTKVSKYVRDRMILGIATLVVTAAFVALGAGLIHWGLLVLHGIVVLWMGVSERNRAV